MPESASASALASALALTSMPAVTSLYPEAPLPSLSCEASLQVAINHISAVEPKLACIFQRHGLPVKLLMKHTSGFHSLARSIVGQQVSCKAAASIFSRLVMACKCDDQEFLLPASILACDTMQLRACGVSERKASYLLGLAQVFSEGVLCDASIRMLSDQDLTAALTKLKGIGPWTVDMFAMFHLGRPDVLPVGDLGVRKGIQTIYGLKTIPTPTVMQTLTDSWRPYRSVGSWCMWHLEAEPTLSPPKRRKTKN